MIHKYYVTCCKVHKLDRLDTQQRRFVQEVHCVVVIHHYTTLTALILQYIKLTVDTGTIVVQFT